MKKFVLLVVFLTVTLAATKSTHNADLVSSKLDLNVTQIKTEKPYSLSDKERFMFITTMDSLMNESMMENNNDSIK